MNRANHPPVPVSALDRFDAITLDVLAPPAEAEPLLTDYLIKNGDAEKIVATVQRVLTGRSSANGQ